MLEYPIQQEVPGPPCFGIQGAYPERYTGHRMYLASVPKKANVLEDADTSFKFLKLHI